MNSFFEVNHFVTNIKSVSRVRNEIATTIHRNRPFHGLVLFTKGESVFKFQDGNTYFIKENQVIYLPKFSNYDSKDAENTETSLIEEFWYPKYGPGQLWETAAAEVERKERRIIHHIQCGV